MFIYLIVELPLLVIIPHGKLTVIETDSGIGQVRPSEVGVAEVRAMQARRNELSGPIEFRKIRAGEIRVYETGIAKVRASHFEVLELDFSQIGIRHNDVIQNGFISQIGFCPKHADTEEIHTIEVGAPEVGVKQIGVGKAGLRLLVIDSAQLGRPEVAVFYVAGGKFCSIKKRLSKNRLFLDCTL